MRQLSSSLPRFNVGHRASAYSDKSKQQWDVGNFTLLQRARLVFARMGRKVRIRLLIGLTILAATYLISQSRK